MIKKGLEWIADQLMQEDPVYSAQGEMQNPQRMMRALEVIRSTNQSITSFRKARSMKRDFSILKIGLDISREKLYARINQRVDKMMELGLLEEAGRLFPHRHLNALQTVGYRELFEHMEGKYTLGRAVELIKQNTRHYAKRQITWFRRDTDIRWFDADDPDLNRHVLQHIRHWQAEGH